MRPLKGVIGAVMGLCLSLCANAHAESYFAYYSGLSHTKASDLHIVQPSIGTNATYHGVGWEGKEFDAPPYYAIKFGMFSKSQPNWGAELDLTHYKVYARLGQTLPLTGTWQGVPVNGPEVMGNRVQKFSISHGVNLISFNLLYRLQYMKSPAFKEGRFQPFIGVGPSYEVLHPENRINGKPNGEGYKPDHLGWQALAGIKYGVAHRTSVFLQAKYSEGDTTSHTADEGWATTRLKTWHSNLGIQYGF